MHSVFKWAVAATCCFINKPFAKGVPLNRLCAQRPEIITSLGILPNEPCDLGIGCSMPRSRSGEGDESIMAVFSFGQRVFQP